MSHSIRNLRCFLLGLLGFCSFAAIAQNQLPPPNYDEAKMPAYELPDPLVQPDGKKIKSAKEWENTQRPAILQNFADHVYGKWPGKPTGMHFQVNEVDSLALEGSVIRKQVTVFFTPGKEGPRMEILMYFPKSAKGPVPVFATLNFCGNHCVYSDPEIALARSWLQNNEKNGVINNKATEASRPTQGRGWPIKEIISRGYGIATVYYGDLEPDHPQGWKDGIRGKLAETLQIKPEEWGAIGAWAWGLSRMQDYLETEPAANAKKTIILGHSRLGKAALWAAANDQRFAMVLSNNSGEGGAALSRRFYGETIANLNTSFPHWFAPAYKEYNGKAGQLPVDQHMLLALMAPRPLYVASAEDDQWSDPKGEFLSAKRAGEVYGLYKKKGIPAETMPQVNQPAGGVVRYHIRTGKHGLTAFDWQQYLKFADEQLK